MKKILLDCTRITDRASMNRLLVQTFDLPFWYSEPIDALQEFLAKPHPPLTIIVTPVKQLLTKTDRYGRAILHVLETAEQQYRNINLILL